MAEWIELDLPPELYERLAEQARARDLTLGEWVSRLLARSDRELARDAGLTLWRRMREAGDLDAP